MGRNLNLIILFIFTFSVGKAQPGSIDLSFDPDFDFIGTGIVTLAIQPDDKIIVGGFFDIPIFNNKIENFARLNKDGSLDLNFKIGSGFNQAVRSIIIQKDEKIIVAGEFDSFNNNSCKNIVRLNKDGSLDVSFNPPSIFGAVHIASWPYDDKTLVYATDNYLHDNIIGRIGDNGKSDTSFHSCVFNNAIYSLAIQTDGKIIVCGNFTKINNIQSKSIARINTDGSWDTTFNTGSNYTYFSSYHVVKIQKNEKILLGGYFFDNNGIRNKSILRYNNNGSLDSTLNTDNGFEKNNTPLIRDIFLQEYGKIIIGGIFNRIKNKNIARLNSDGTLDSNFKTDLGFDKDVVCISQQSDNKIIVAGLFNKFNSYLTSRIVRLNNFVESILIFSISPNPSNGIFKISASQSIKIITITDILGKEILRTEPMVFDTEIDLTNKSPGLYFVKVFSENESKCQKILIK